MKEFAQSLCKKIKTKIALTQKIKPNQTNKNIYILGDFLKECKGLKLSSHKPLQI